MDSRDEAASAPRRPPKTTRASRSVSASIRAPGTDGPRPAPVEPPAAAGRGRPATGAAAPNRPPTVKASCNPCSVEVGRTALVTADAQDPDGDPLTYQWAAQGRHADDPNGQTDAVGRRRPMTGPVPFTVTVNDGRGGTASGQRHDSGHAALSAAVRVRRRALRVRSVHASSDALAILDDAVKAMQANPTCASRSRGTPATSARMNTTWRSATAAPGPFATIWSSRNIAQSRLTTVSYGEERPRHDNSREDTRRLNRRAALVVRLQ